MQLPGGSQGPGETERVLKRQAGRQSGEQAGCLPSLGSFPGMTGPGGMAPRCPGFSQAKARGAGPSSHWTWCDPTPGTH